LGNNAAVAALLSRGANPSLVDSTGRSALARAREAQNISLVKLLESARKPAAKS
jgi:ankyrin repeat protein